MGRSQESFNKKEREKKRKKKKAEKRERREQRKQESKKSAEFMYVDEFGNLSPTPPEIKKSSEIKASDIKLSPEKKSYDDRPKYVRSGVVKYIDSSRGYAFVKDNQSGDSYYAHPSELEQGIKLNDRVQFKEGKGPKGPIALKVTKET